MCPESGTATWECLARVKSCPPGTQYHCARNYVDSAFVEECAREKICSAGREPRLDIQKNLQVNVFCELCHGHERFNPYQQTSSATFSECPMLKQACAGDAHSIALPEQHFYTEDRLCQCNTTGHYCSPGVAHPRTPSRELRCVYVGHCPPTNDGRRQHLLPDCSCVPNEIYTP